MKKQIFIASLISSLFTTHLLAEEKTFSFDCNYQDTDTHISFYKSNDKIWNSSKPSKEQLKDKIYEFNCLKGEGRKEISFNIEGNTLYTLTETNDRDLNIKTFDSTNISDGRTRLSYSSSNILMRLNDTLIDNIALRYKVSEDEKTFVDTKLNKMWQIIPYYHWDIGADKKVVNPSDMINYDTDRMTHSMAEQYCSNLKLGGFDNWRLPTKEEFFSTQNDRVVTLYATNQLHRTLTKESMDYFDIDNKTVRNMYLMFSTRYSNDSNEIIFVSPFEEAGYTYNYGSISVENPKNTFGKSNDKKAFVSCVRDNL